MAVGPANRRVVLCFGAEIPIVPAGCQDPINIENDWVECSLVTRPGQFQKPARHVLLEGDSGPCRPRVWPRLLLLAERAPRVRLSSSSSRTQHAFGGEMAGFLADGILLF
jgi:hypothetical protein